MTRVGGDKVSLTFGNWVGVIAVLASVIVVPLLALQGRMTSVEKTTEYHGQRIDHIEGEARNARTEILGEIKELRTDLKQMSK